MKRIFAHYVPWFPVSIDNKAPAADYYATQYLRAPGDGSGAWGPYLRDRPAPRAPLPGDWKTTDLLAEIDTAIAHGIDGFMVDVTGDPYTSTAWSTQQISKLLTAADSRPGFSVGLMLDMNAVGSMTPQNLATMTVRLAAHKSALRLDDGRLVVAPFLAERWTVAAWSTYLTAMTSAGVPVAFVPCFLNFSGNVAAFAPISYGFGNWGNRSPGANSVTQNASYAAKAHGLGKIWMQPVSNQDVRPHNGLYWEAGNTENLRLTWKGAIDGNADWIMLTTWNDYAEGTQFAPTERCGDAWLRLSAFYGTWFRTGTAPTIDRHRLFLSHRRQFTADPPAYMHPAPGSDHPRDMVEVLAFTPTAGAIVATVGGVDIASPVNAPGIIAALFPLVAGTVSARFVVGRGRLRASVSSPVAVSHTPIVQDLAYLIYGG